MCSLPNLAGRLTQVRGMHAVRAKIHLAIRCTLRKKENSLILHIGQISGGVQKLTNRVAEGDIGRAFRKAVHALMLTTDRN